MSVREEETTLVRVPLSIKKALDELRKEKKVTSASALKFYIEELANQKTELRLSELATKIEKLEEKIDRFLALWRWHDAH